MLAKNGTAQNLMDPSSSPGSLFQGYQGSAHRCAEHLATEPPPNEMAVPEVTNNRSFTISRCTDLPCQNLSSTDLLCQDLSSTDLLLQNLTCTDPLCHHLASHLSALVLSSRPTPRLHWLPPCTCDRPTEGQAACQKHLCARLS